MYIIINHFLELILFLTESVLTIYGLLYFILSIVFLLLITFLFYLIKLFKFYLFLVISDLLEFESLLIIF